MTRFVYVITDGADAVKIGVAGDPIQRLAELQVGNHRKLTIATTFRHMHSELAEALWHSRLSQYRAEGEWFVLNEKLRKAVISLVSRGHIPHPMKQEDQKKQNRCSLGKYKAAVRMVADGEISDEVSTERARHLRECFFGEFCLENELAEISQRTANILSRIGIKEVSQMAFVSESDVASIPGIGPTAIAEIAKVVHRSGISFARTNSCTDRQSIGRYSAQLLVNLRNGT